MVNAPRVGFIGWNPFQVLHALPLAKTIPGSCFVIEKRKEFIEEFTDAVLIDHGIPFIVWDRAKMPLLDGVFDVIICQTPFFRIETFEKTKIVMLQYGYAKEPHNYGAWRSLADLCLTYGPYATTKVEPFCPAVSVGNPRYDDWALPGFHENAIRRYGDRIDNSKKTVLYLPTWGDLSSVDQYLESVYSLSSSYNVLLKLHHNTELLEADRKDKIVESRISHFGANDDLLELISISDIVISDYSGAIFDAIFCEKPVILVNSAGGENAKSKKMDTESIEYSRREELGLVVDEPSALAEAVECAAKDPSGCMITNAQLRTELFTDTASSKTLAYDAIKALCSGKFQRTQTQRYIRSEIIDLLVTKRLLAIAAKKNKGKK